MRDHAIKKKKNDKRSKEDFISDAWSLQKMNSSWAMDLENQVAIVDVDAECLEALEERMFERSKVAGLAGYYQWGLDAGYHQGHWDPWAGTPSEWNREDFDGWSESELEVSESSLTEFQLAMMSYCHIAWTRFH